MRHFLDFERPVAELESKIEELRRMQEPGGIDIETEVSQLEDKVVAQVRLVYAKLTPWQKTQVARHPERPKAQAYIDALITEYTPLAGDRAFADDAAVLGGLGRFEGRPVVVLGTERGSDTESRVAHNFGMARPEGYRKARRLIELAGRFRLPVLTFVDTAGAFPGIEAEARGQAEAIARAIEACLEAPVPIVATIIGEGGFRRCHRAGRRRPGADAGALRLFGDLARGLCQHPVARRRAGGHRGRGAAADRAGPAGLRDRGPGGGRAAGRRPPRPGGDGCQRGGGDRGRPGAARRARRRHAARPAPRQVSGHGAGRGVNDDPAGLEPPPPSSRTLFFQVYPSIVLPMFLAAIDNTIVATALPNIAATLGDVERVSWVVVSYLMATTIAAAVYGRLGDALGRKRLLIVSLCVFIVASLLCAVAPTMLALVAARVLQGIGGGGLMTLCQALVGEVVPPRERGASRATWRRCS